MKPEMCVWQLLSQSIWLENGRKGDITQVLSEKVLEVLQLFFPSISGLIEKTDNVRPL